MLSIWIKGTSRTGKTTRLIARFCDWTNLQVNHNPHWQQKISMLVFAANNDNRRQLAGKLAKAIEGKYPIICKTPLGFFQDEVILFWPLLCEQLHIKARFPLCLRPETEQELATKLWENQLNQESWQLLGIEQDRLVRNILDLLQLAGASTIKIEEISTRLEQGLGITEFLAEVNYSEIWQQWGQLLQQWRSWCLDRSFLTYGLIYELYGRYLLPNQQYQKYLINKYSGVFADDMDDYPAITRNLFDFLLDKQVFGVFTYNPEGKIRLGINADPDYLEGLGNRCQQEDLSNKNILAETAVKLIVDSSYNDTLPDSVAQISAITRASLLKKVAEYITVAIQQGEVSPGEIAIIAPGLDDIGRYSLIDLLSAQDIPIEPLNEQRPLISYAHIRALLSLLCLIYPNLGKLAPPDAVGEMLIVLSQKNINKHSQLIADIDPVRAGLLIDHCYQIDLKHPLLLDFETTFPRWDRLGYRASKAYREICSWLDETKLLLEEITFIGILDRAIKYFYNNGINLTCAQLSALRELIEAAQHYWEVNQRQSNNSAIVSDFIQLLRQGTITANHRPIGILGNQKESITLATIFQYRQQRSCHRWHFWLDANSHLWKKGGAANLFAAPLFLQNWQGKPLTLENQEIMDEERLIRIVQDLFTRATEKVFLCHSDLDINGNEQIAGLSPLIYAALAPSL